VILFVLASVGLVWLGIVAVFLAACVIAGRADRGTVAAAAPSADDQPVLRLVGARVG
jgi:hypothetical protein